jgi:exopolyphosphatase/guanosine-5'-triphosphate,3'-diphosphate pyrophosphatase
VIDREAFQRALSFLTSYRETSEKFESERVVAVGTSALRDASNRREFCEFVHQKIGMTIEILSGDEEAEWTFRGVIGEDEETAETFTVLDIGGGSTEIISGTRSKILRKASLDIGCVRIAERVLLAYPPTEEMVAEARALVRSALGTFDFAGINSSRAIAVAGTVTTLAAMRLRLEHYDPEKVEGFVLVLDDVREEFDRMKTKTIDELRAIRQISPGRADILLAGILILQEFMETARLPEISVSDRGLRYGIVQRELLRKKTTY